MHGCILAHTMGLGEYREIGKAFRSCHLIIMHRQNIANDYIHHFTMHRDFKKESSRATLLDGKLCIVMIVQPCTTIVVDTDLFSVESDIGPSSIDNHQQLDE